MFWEINSNNLLSQFGLHKPSMWRMLTALLLVTIYIISGTDSSTWTDKLPDNKSSIDPHCDKVEKNCGPAHSPLNMNNYRNGGWDWVFLACLCSRSIGLVFGYHQLKVIHSLGSRQTLGLTCAFAALSSLLFTTIANLLYNNENEFRDPISYFILICDLPKAAILASMALTGPSSFENIRSNIIKGLRLMGPLLFVDTLFALLVISLGFLTGIRGLQELCSFASLSVSINFIIFLTIYPAFILQIIKLSKKSRLEDRTLLKDDFLAATNSAQNRSLKLSENIQHFIILDGSRQQEKILGIISLGLGHIFWWFSISLDQLIFLTLTLVLAIKYLFFEDKYHFCDSNQKELFPSSSENIPAGPCATRKTGNIFKSDLVDFTKETPVQRVLPVSVGPLVQSSIISEDGMNFGKFLQSKTSSFEGKTKDKKHDQLLTIRTPDPGYASTTTSDTNSGSVSPIAFSIGDHSDSDSDQDELLKHQDRKISTDSVGIQTLDSALREISLSEKKSDQPPRSVEECLSIYKSDDGAKTLTDHEVIALVDAKHIPAYQLEKAVDDPERGVAIRRQLLARLGEKLSLGEDLPYQHYDYSLVMGACCENVVGYIPIPIGVAGPFNVDDSSYHIPMATTEGCLVASTNRGCRALVNGVKTRVFADGMSRAPVVRFPSSVKASDALLWLNEEQNFIKIKEAFDSSSRFARLQKVHCRIAGRFLFIRFVARTGDAMGMNMISKGTEIALNTLSENHPDMEILSLSGNVCTDKKPAAINWIEGRGKSVVAEAVVPANIVENVLKTSVEALVELNMAKNLVGSAMAGSIGGFNAHAANIVTAIYIATGQDPAQNIGSSNCMTLMEPWGTDGRDLFISCTMPSIEVGTVGGGTFLPAQSACLEMLGVKGANIDCPGENARTLARLVCATVLAGELSLMSALAAGHLVRSHLKHNRSTASFNATGSAPTTPIIAVKSNSLSPANIVTVPQPPCRLSSKIDKQNTSAPSIRNGSTKSVVSSSKKSTVSSRQSSMEFLNVPDCKQS